MAKKIIKKAIEPIIQNTTQVTQVPDSTATKKNIKTEVGLPVDANTLAIIKSGVEMGDDIDTVQKTIKYQTGTTIHPDSLEKHYDIMKGTFKNEAEWLADKNLTPEQRAIKERAEKEKVEAEQKAYKESETEDIKKNLDPKEWPELFDDNGTIKKDWQFIYDDIRKTEGTYDKEGNPVESGATRSAHKLTPDQQKAKDQQDYIDARNIAMTEHRKKQIRIDSKISNRDIELDWKNNAEPTWRNDVWLPSRNPAEMEKKRIKDAYMNFTKGQMKQGKTSLEANELWKERQTKRKEKGLPIGSNQLLSKFLDINKV